MAEKYPLANGLWSNAANWNGGTKPVAGDVVHTNNFILDIDEDVDVGELRTDAGTTAVAGGYFVVNSDNLTISCDFVWPNDNNFGIQVNSNNGTTTIIGDFYMPKGNSATQHCSIYIAGTCQLNLVGSILNKDNSGAQLSRDNSGVIIDVTGGRLNITGNVEGGRNTDNYNRQNAGIYIRDTSCIVNIVGDVSGGPIGGGSTTNINSGIYVEPSNNTINIVGDVIGTYDYHTPSIIFWSNSDNNVVNITGTIQSSEDAAGIIENTYYQNNEVRLFGNVVNGGSRMAIQVSNFILDDATDTSWKFIDDANNDKYLYSVGSGVLGQAAESDVKLSTVYGPSNELTGTYDPDVVDVAQLAIDLAEEIRTSSEPEWVRVRNCQTPEINQQQLTATLGG